MNDAEKPRLTLSELPTELPIESKGWTKRLDVHYNFGSKGGGAISGIYDASGRRAPINYQYDTRKVPEWETGFVITWEGKFYGKVVPTWAMLRKEYSEFIANVRPAA